MPRFLFSLPHFFLSAGYHGDVTLLPLAPPLVLACHSPVSLGHPCEHVVSSTHPNVGHSGWGQGSGPIEPDQSQSLDV